MTTFYLSSVAGQSTLLIALFLTLILSLLLLLAEFGRNHNKWKKILFVSVFIFLFVLLAILSDAFSRINDGLEYSVLLPVPMWLLWCVVFFADFLFAVEIRRLYLEKGQTISRDSVKQAFDLLPSGICYFSPSGAVKLCNMQMHRLFRTLAQSDLQTLDELNDALENCDSCSGIIRLSDEKQTYLFPDGKAWHYSQSSVTNSDGITYTEAVFSDMTELYHKNLELKRQIRQLNEISRELKQLSDNALILTKEKEVLSAKTKLHDRMGAGLIAMRQILQHNQTEETKGAVELFRQAVNAIKNDNDYPQGNIELSKFMQDSEAIGIKVNLTGELPEQEELCHVMILAMRECLTNSVRHADASTLNITVEKVEDSISMKITNDGKVPDTEVVAKGGLHNLYRNVTDCGGTMKIQSKPIFLLTVILPVSEEDE
ncbi:MAG: hypothetical protein ACI4XP_06195 [Acutalibacteraceae bacterium]